MITSAAQKYKRTRRTETRTAEIVISVTCLRKLPHKILDFGLLFVYTSSSCLIFMHIFSCFICNVYISSLNSQKQI